jgi:hypothetical protein
MVVEQRVLQSNVFIGINNDEKNRWSDEPLTSYGNW